MKNYTIKEIKEILKGIEQFDSPIISELKEDRRKGVQSALKSWQKRLENIQKEKELFKQMNKFEESLINEGFEYIAGTDEVGRGPLAGPVVAASVILNPDDHIIGLQDSKKLSENKRLKLFDEIKQRSLAYSVCEVDAQTIDQINILEASKQAMVQAVNNLTLPPEYVLVDAEELSISQPQEKLIKGDSISNSIAAASILAKVTRDHLMQRHHQKYPMYGWDRNAGYGTKAHLQALAKYGPSPLHRRSFGPVKSYY